ncbi:caspase domain-containing protein [Pyxidicoccus sp. 3LFB2]
MESQVLKRRSVGRRGGWAMAVLVALLGTAALGAPQRMAVVVGSNGAAGGRPALRYAHEDARRMAEVLVQVGEFRPEHVKLLLDPSPEALMAAVDERINALRGKAGETLLLFYYSGHADPRFLYPGGQALAVDELRKRVDSPAATVRLGIIDACSGGGWTQAKGLQPDAQPFQVHVPMVVGSEGSVLLASSSGLENAHEAETLRGSFFTHHLVAALRGAADQAGDGEVSVVEAFSYARERTVRDTSLMGIAPQHPSFELNLRGRSDLALTRVASAGSLLQLQQTQGPLTVMQAGSGGQVAELAHGERHALLALPPGRYLVVRKDEGGKARAREVTLRKGETVTLEEGSLEPVGATSLLLKGGPPPTRTLSLSLFPSGEFMGEAFGVEFEQALGRRFSVAIAPYVDNYANLGATLSGRVFVVGRAPSGFWLGAAGYGEYETDLTTDSWRSNLVGVGPTAGYTFIYAPYMASLSATPFAQWRHIPGARGVPPDAPLGWSFDRINTKVRVNLGVAF